MIRRSDGSPLYNLAVAVDDRDMGITHVVRGEDHISNTPRQVMILRALGAEPPVYAHLPLLHGPDGKKLSKRHGAASVQELRDAGYLPEAVRNYIALLGWGYDESTTFFTTEELIRHFDLSRVSRNPAVFDEQKLRWMNGRYLRELSVEDLRARLERFTGRELPTEAVAISQDKMQTLADFWPLAGFLVERREFETKAWDKVMRDGAATGCRRPARRWSRRAVRRGGRSSRRCAAWSSASASSPRRSSSPCGWRSAAPRSRRGSSSRWRRSGATRRWPGSIPRSKRPLAADRRPLKRSRGMPIAHDGPHMRAAATTTATGQAPVVSPHSEGHGRRLTAAFDALEASRRWLSRATASCASCGRTAARWGRSSRRSSPTSRS